MNLKSSQALAAALSLSLLTGCGHERAGDAPAPVTRAAAGLSAEARAVAEAAGRKFAEDVREGRATAVAERFDLGAFVRAVCAGTGATKAVREDFRSGLEQGLAEREGGLMADYVRQDFRFLRLVETDASTQMLFRAWDEGSGIDYLRCAFDRAEAEEWRIVDVFSYTAGEPFSESVRRTYLPVLAGGAKARELRAQYEPFGVVIERLDAKDYLGARRSLVAVSEALRAQRFARVLELEVLSHIDEAAADYAGAVAQFERDFPDDPSLPLRMLEAHSIRGEHAESLQRVDQIDALLGGDAFLNFLRAGALEGLGREAEAVDGLRAAIAAEPEIEELRWALVHAALPAGEFGAVAETLRALRTDFEYQIDAEEIKTSENYREFAESEEGRAFLEEIRTQE